ncbi:MAG: ATP-binding cassette domain-containing protein [Ruminococcus sp.]|nr:ATP-binding cassette domain-containing protein [Ruminococcus sp.]
MRLDNICKSYRTPNGDIPVLSGFSLEIEDGGVTWIMGRSGAGKTTLLRIIAGLEDFEGGIERTAGGGIGFMFQEDRLFPDLTASENVTVTGAGREDAEKYLAAAGLSGKDISRPVSELSGGMKRRTALVRTLLYPSGGILLMDEPFKGLDGATRSSAARLVAELRKGRTLIAVTHDIADTELIGGKIVKMHKIPNENTEQI